MKFHAYQIGEQPIDIEPAPFEREWMNATHDRFAYRCLPLNIANAHGWEVLSPAGFSAIWRAGDRRRQNNSRRGGRRGRLKPDIMEGRIQPGRVFDRTVGLEGVPDGYRAMNDREALKVMVRP